MDLRVRELEETIIDLRDELRDLRGEVRALRRVVRLLAGEAHSSRASEEPERGDSLRESQDSQRSGDEGSLGSLSLVGRPFNGDASRSRSGSGYQDAGRGTSSPIHLQGLRRLARSLLAWAVLWLIVCSLGLSVRPSARRSGSTSGVLLVEDFVVRADETKLDCLQGSGWSFGTTKAWSIDQFWSAEPLASARTTSRGAKTVVSPSSLDSPRSVKVFVWPVWQGFLGPQELRDDGPGAHGWHGRNGASASRRGGTVGVRWRRGGECGLCSAGLHHSPRDLNSVHISGSGGEQVPFSTPTEFGIGSQRSVCCLRICFQNRP